MKVSNNSLVVLLGIAIVASVAGTFVSINFIDDVITGAATGNVTLTVSSTANCFASDSLIAFGNLGQNETNDTAGAANDTLTLENSGNVDVNITAHATVELFSTQGAPTSYWRLQCNATQSGTCNSTWVNVEASGNPGILLTELSFSDSTDQANISANVTVPEAEPAGAKNGEITFTCTQS